MDQQKNKLLVFGYGLALIIPFIILMHLLKPDLTFAGFIVMFLLGLGLCMFVSAKVAHLKTIYNVWIYLYQALIFYVCFQGGLGPVAKIFSVASVLVLSITIFKVDLLSPFYTGWMKVAHVIGEIITGLIMVIIYFAVFTPMGIFFRIIRKDFLDRTLNSEVETYWIKRDEKPNEPERYTKQF